MQDEPTKNLLEPTMSTPHQVECLRIPWLRRGGGGVYLSNFLVRARQGTFLFTRHDAICRVPHFFESKQLSSIRVNKF